MRIKTPLQSFFGKVLGMTPETGGKSIFEWQCHRQQAYAVSRLLSTVYGAFRSAEVPTFMFPVFD